MLVVDILKSARQRVSIGWCRVALHRIINKDGTDCYCCAGAMMACFDQAEPEISYDKVVSSIPELAEAMEVFLRHVPTEYLAVAKSPEAVWKVIEINDDNTIDLPTIAPVPEWILETFDKAIASCE